MTDHYANLLYASRTQADAFEDEFRKLVDDGGLDDIVEKVVGHKERAKAALDWAVDYLRIKPIKMVHVPGRFDMHYENKKRQITMPNLGWVVKTRNLEQVVFHEVRHAYQYDKGWLEDVKVKMTEELAVSYLKAIGKTTGTFDYVVLFLIRWKNEWWLQGIYKTSRGKTMPTYWWKLKSGEDVYRDIEKICSRRPNASKKRYKAYFNLPWEADCVEAEDRMFGAYMMDLTDEERRRVYEGISRDMK